MVIKGGSRSGGGNLAAHLLRTDTNERAEVMELQGVVADRLPEALREMEAVATGTRCRRSLYHASINTGPGEELTLEQKAMAVARLEMALGLEGHARAVVEHRKEGRDHLHVVWSRIDVDTMRAVHDGHNYRKHEAVARDLEREFGHKRVQGAHIERETPEGDRLPRPPRTPVPDQVQQATRTKRDLAGVAADLNRLWRAADTGPAFAAALEGAGYVLTQGDRRGFVVIDQAGGVHSLARRIEGAKTKDVNVRLAGVELASLPTADQARAMQRDRSLPAKERPAGRLAAELTRPADARAERTATLTAEDERRDAARQQIRADLDKHLRDQAEKRPQAPEMAPGAGERASAPEAAARPVERAQPSPDRRDGPDFQQQIADSAEYRREQAEAARPRPAVRPAVKSEAAKDAGRAIGKAGGLLGTGLGRAAGGALGILGKLFGASQAVDSAATPAQPTRPQQQPQSERPSRPQRTAAPPAPVRKPAPRPSVFDEIQAKIRERDAQGGKAAPTPQPEKDRDRSRFEIRPSIRLQAIVSGDYMGWVTEAKRRLIAYSERTGESVLAQLSELEAIVFRAVYGDQRGPG